MPSNLEYLDENYEKFNVGISNLVILISNAAKVLGINLTCKYLPLGSNCNLVIKTSKKIQGS